MKTVIARRFLFATAFVGLLAAPAIAQPAASGPPNALQGFSQNRNQPVSINANSLEVRDKEQSATFNGDVQVVQGDTTLKCRTLNVFYEQGSGSDGLQAAKPGPGGQTQIRKLEAKGGVVVTQKEQIATGEMGVFDMHTNTVTLSGNVVMTQGQNVLRGERLIVNMTTGVTRVESGKSKNGTGQVQGLIVPGSTPGGNPFAPAAATPTGSQPAPSAKPATGPKETPKPERPAVSAPLRLN
ncbi:MAG TPA: LptA/OstA family protein [Xanthobacteraceae bacterium]|jgi:lipopolysaccharide export system protein LptA|nr:LptA/OstA family protein [Xanthobacteraceae bacterium]